MRIAVPVAGELFCEHFGRCDGFYVCDVEDGLSRRPRVLRRPRAKCESVPQWLAEVGVRQLLVGGIGAVGARRMTELGIEVVPGHTGTDPAVIVAAHLAGRVRPGENPCPSFEHRHHHCKQTKRPGARTK